MFVKKLFEYLFIGSVLIISQPNQVSAQLGYTYPTDYGFELKDELLTYCTFPKDYILFSDCAAKEICPGNTAEDLLWSKVSSNDSNWVKSLYSYDVEVSDDYYTQRLTPSRKNEFFQLARKLEFEANGSKYAFVKYYKNEDHRRIAKLDFMKETSSGWLIQEMNVIESKLGLFILYANLQIIDALFKKGQVGINYIDNNINDSWMLGKLDLVQALQTSENEIMAANNIPDSLLLDPTFLSTDQYVYNYEDFDFKTNQEIVVQTNKVKCYFPVSLDKQYFTRFDRVGNEPIERFTSILSKDEKPIFAFEFDYSDEHYVVYRFQSTLSDGSVTTQTNLYIDNHGVLALHTSAVNQLNEILDLFSKMSLDFYVHTSYNSPHKDHPNLDNIKEYINGSNNSDVININRLIDGIELFRSELSEYFIGN